MRSTRRGTVALLVNAALFGAIVACGAPTAASSTSSPPSATATPSPEATKPFPVVQPQLPLPTRLRWAIDKGNPDDPQRRSLLVLFYDGNVSGWRVIDASGVEQFRVPIAGSGIHGPDSCVSKARGSNEVTTWVSLDEATLTRFVQGYRTLRAIGDGIPAGSVTLDLVDSGCRGT